MLSFAELRDAAREVTRAALAWGIGPGDPVAIWAPNSARWVVTALGLLSAGAVLVPLSTRYRAGEAAYILGRSRCRALFTVRGFLGNDYPLMLAESGVPLPDLEHTVLLAGEATPSTLDLRAFLELASHISIGTATTTGARIDPDSVSDILFTSGTTGLPKGVMATHAQTLQVYTRWSAVTTLRRADRYLLINPFSHTFGYKAGILASVLRGVTMVPVPLFDSDQVLHRIEKERISVLLGPPTIFAGLLDHPKRTAHDLRSLRLTGTGGTAVPAELIHRIRTDLGVSGVFTAYGLTESTGVVSVCPPDADTDIVAGTAGPALPGTEIRVVGADGTPVPPGQHGEILTRGRNVMRGYLDDPVATRAAIDADGWLHTGDIGTLNAQGYLRVTDRLKDMFIVGGFNAYPAEIERVLSGHPGIREVAVVGVPDPRLGEVGVAYVVREPHAGDDAAAIIAWARQRMAGYKVPRRAVFVNSLPRNASGKVLKRELRRWAARPRPASSRR